MNKTVKEFVDFVRVQGVVGLAVGLAIGVAASGAVSSIVNNLISPIVGFILGNESLSGLSWTVVSLKSGRELTIGWGAILDSIITLVATALVIYLMVKKLGLDKLDKPKQ
ncbi:MscL family protein [Candidatus Saccharibacteria bacterium]|nr:MscL family protein [Candidatus Saccharibacteria bacterium]MCB9821166.1 MscL family protein [Candidatus Nomurabacteria bacterium]